MKIVGNPTDGYTMELNFDELELVSMGLLSGEKQADKNLEEHPILSDDVKRQSEDEHGPQIFLGDLFAGTKEGFMTLHYSLVEQLGYDPADG